MTRPAYIGLLLAVAAIGVTGCGGNDGGSASKASAERGATGQQGTTGLRTGASGATGTKRARPKQTGKSKQRSDPKTGAGNSDAGPAPPAAPTAKKKRAPKPGALTPEQLKGVGAGQAEQARELCKASTLEGLAQYYGIKSGDPDEVAKAFAATYLVGVRKQVAAGCKKGLLESK
jgi:hypothetical protein